MAPKLVTAIVTIICCTSLVNGYTRTIPTPAQAQASSWSGTRDDDLAEAKCPTSKPTIVSCDMVSRSTRHEIDGSYVSGGVCYAQNGSGNSDGVKSAALCQSSDFSCF